jgi:hypothetical protein
LLEQRANHVRIDAHANNDLGKRLPLLQSFEHESGKFVARALGRDRRGRVRIATS